MCLKLVSKMVSYVHTAHSTSDKSFVIALTLNGFAVGIIQRKKRKMGKTLESNLSCYTHTYNIKEERVTDALFISTIFYREKK